MNAPSDWPLILLAGGATALAIDAGTDLAVAVPAGLIAVGVAGLLLVTSLGEVAWRGPPPRTLEPPTATSSLRAAFRSGRAGRISVVVELDRLERRGPHPDLPSRTEAEETKLRSMSLPAFRAYLSARLDQIEARDP